MNPALNPSHRPVPIPVHLILCVFVLYLFRFGYGYGASDQDEFLPYLAHLQNPELFANDWFVQSQAASFNIRTCFVYLLFGLSAVMPPFYATTLVYALSWFGIAAGLYALAYALSADRLSAIACVGGALVLTPFWTLGGNDLAHSMLVPSMVAWALAVWSWVLLVQDRPAGSAVLVGLATWFQGLVGLQTALLIGAYLVAGPFVYAHPLARGLRKTAVFSIVFVLCSFPALGPLLYQQLFGASMPDGHAPHDLFYIMASFRNPHHYLFHSFPASRVVRFAAILVPGLCAALWGLRTRMRPASIFVLTVSSVIAVVCAISYLGTEWRQQLFVAKLQLFKTTVTAKFLFLILLCTAVIGLIPASMRQRLEGTLFDYPGRILGVLALVSLAIGAWQPDRIASTIYPLSRSSAPAYEMTSWIQAHTPGEAVFAVPPSRSDFRSHAQRGIVVNHKAFPYRDEDMVIWFERLLTLAPVPLPARSDPYLQARLDSAFLSLSPETLYNLAQVYPFDYVLRTTPWTAPADSLFAPVHARDGEYLYALIPHP